MRAIVLIGDLIHSKKIANRRHFQKSFERILKNVSSSKIIISPYTVTLGDEFQAVYQSASGIFTDLLSIANEIRPVECRFSLGIGHVATRINKSAALGMDGPAFHMARASIEELKESGSLFSIKSDKESFIIPVINDALKIISTSMLNWPDSRYKIIANLAQGSSVEEIADITKTSKQAVYKSVHHAKIKTLLDFFKGLEIWIDKENL